MRRASGWEAEGGAFGLGFAGAMVSCCARSRGEEHRRRNKRREVRAMDDPPKKVTNLLTRMRKHWWLLPMKGNFLGRQQSEGSPSEAVRSMVAIRPAPHFLRAQIRNCEGIIGQRKRFWGTASRFQNSRKSWKTQGRAASCRDRRKARQEWFAHVDR